MVSPEPSSKTRVFPLAVGNHEQGHAQRWLSRALVHQKSTRPVMMCGLIQTGPQCQPGPAVAAPPDFVQSQADGLKLLVHRPMERRPGQRITKRYGGELVPIQSQMAQRDGQGRDQQAGNVTGMQDLPQSLPRQAWLTQQKSPQPVP